MTWDRVKSAALTALMAFRRPAIGQHGQPTPAQNTAQKSAPVGNGGAPTTAIDLRARALTLHNRNPKLAAVYVEKHHLLMTKGRG